MTKEEAIANLKMIGVAFVDVNTVEQVKLIDETFNIAIKALEQEFMLDKIGAEIDQKQYDFMANKDYDEGVRFGLMLAYQIINKYKTESEDKK